jgi:hypothetical protein
MGQEGGLQLLTAFAVDATDLTCMCLDDCSLEAEMAHRTEHSSVRLGSTRFDRVEQAISVR